MAIYDDLDDRGDRDDFIERCRRDFEETGNPLYVWEALGRVNSRPRPTDQGFVAVPDWIAEYLTSCSRRLLGWQPELVGVRSPNSRLVPEESPPDDNDRPGSIGRALGLKKSLRTTRKWWGGQFDDQERLARAVVELMFEEGLALDWAALKFERRGPARATAQRAVRGSERYALRYMQDCLSEVTGNVPPLAEVLPAFRTMCRARGKQAR